MNKETNQKNQVHGDSWSAVMGGEDFDVEVLIKRIVETPGCYVKKTENVSGVLNFNPPIRGFVLIKINQENAEVVSAYPFLHISNPISVLIERIEEWDDGLEAVIWLDLFQFLFLTLCILQIKINIKSINTILFSLEPSLIHLKNE